MENSLIWHLEKRQLKDLRSLSKNPRQFSKDKEEKLSASMKELGLIDRPCVNLDNTIIGGHQRIRVLKKSGEKEIDVFVPNRMLSIKEVEKANILLNKINGSFDFDILANEWDQDDLLDYGFTKEELELEFSPLPDIQTDPINNDQAITIIIKVGNEEASSLENQLQKVVSLFSSASMKRKK